MAGLRSRRILAGYDVTSPASTRVAVLAGVVLLALAVLPAAAQTAQLPRTPAELLLAPEVLRALDEELSGR